MIILEKVTKTKINEFDDVIKLINQIFRSRINELPTMKEEFPLLLNENNIDNMRIIKKDNQVVSVVNFMKDIIKIEGLEINYGAIGAVCTKAEYTKRGYSSLILDDVEKSMDDQNVDICLISGTRSLYTRRDAIIAKSFKIYNVEPESMDLGFKIRNYEEKDLVEMMRLYNQQSTRYSRSMEDFRKLINSGTHNWGEFSYTRHVFIRDNNVVGYVVIRTIENKERKYGEIVELRGTTLDVHKGLKQLAHELNLSKIEYAVHIKDKLNHLDQYFRYELGNQEGVIKIINYERFIKKLRGYFEMYLTEQEIEHLRFTYDKGYNIEFYDEKIKLSNLKEITDIIFGYDEIEKIEFQDNSKLEKILKNIFPLPMPWTKNLNYQ